MVTGIIEATNPVDELTMKISQFTTGAVLMLVNSAMVASIGMLLYPLLGRFSRAIAWSYLAVRTVEAAALAAGVMSLLFLVSADVPVTQAEIVTASRGNFSLSDRHGCARLRQSLLLCVALPSSHRAALSCGVGVCRLRRNIVTIRLSDDVIGSFK